MRFQSFRAGRKAQRPDEANTIAYAERFSEACRLLSTKHRCCFGGCGRGIQKLIQAIALDWTAPNR